MPKIASCQGQHLNSVAVKISDLLFDSKSTIAVIFYANVYSKYYKKYSCKELEESVKNIEEPDIDKTAYVWNREEEIKMASREKCSKNCKSCFWSMERELFP